MVAFTANVKDEEAVALDEETVALGEETVALDEEAVAHDINGNAGKHHPNKKGCRDWAAPAGWGRLAKAARKTKCA